MGVWSQTERVLGHIARERAYRPYVKKVPSLPVRPSFHAAAVERMRRWKCQRPPGRSSSDFRETHRDYVMTHEPPATIRHVFLVSTLGLTENHLACSIRNSLPAHNLLLPRCRRVYRRRSDRLHIPVYLQGCF